MHQLRDATANIDDNTNVKFNLIISTSLIRLKSTTMNAKAQQECVTLIDFHVAETRSMRSAHIQLKSHCRVNCIENCASMWFVFCCWVKTILNDWGLQIKRTLGFSGLTISIFGPSLSLSLSRWNCTFPQQFVLPVDFSLLSFLLSSISETN